MNIPSAEIIHESRIMIRPISDEASVLLPEPYHGIIEATVQYVLAALLCVTAYIRLREKEF